MIDPYYIVILPVLISAVIYFFPYGKSRFVMLLMQVCILTAAVINFLSVRESGTQIIPLGSFAPISLISFRYDLQAAVFVMLTAFIFLALIIFNFRADYMNSLFIFLFTTLQCLIIAVFLSNDLFNIYVIYEVSILIVSILIMFKKETTSIYDGFMYLMINITAMTFFLLGIGFIYRTFGTLDMDMVKERLAYLEDAGSLVLPYALIMTAVCLKTALMPLFSWLPHAHASKGSPSVISAVLSGLYVKASIYIFIRIKDMFSPLLDMSDFFIVVGIITGITGFVLAVSQKDIKLILAYSTISQLGLIIVGLNSASMLAFYGTLYHIINHAVFKTNLFLTAGIITDAYGTRDINNIRGLAGKMPLISIAAVMSILGITGAPLFNGSISKFFLYGGMEGSLAGISIFIINLGTIIIYIKYSSIFFGASGKALHKPDLYRTITVSSLSVLCFLGGIFGPAVIKYLFNVSTGIVLLEYLDRSLIFLLSLVIGFLFYQFAIKNSKLFVKVRSFELGFNDICVSITIFFIIVAALTSLKIS